MQRYLWQRYFIHTIQFIEHCVFIVYIEFVYRVEDCNSEGLQSHVLHLCYTFSHQTSTSVSWLTSAQNGRNLDLQVLYINTIETNVRYVYIHTYLVAAQLRVGTRQSQCS